MGDPHPGCNKTINATAAGATSDKPNPTRPALNRPETGSTALGLGATIQGDSNLTSIGWLTVSTGARLN